LLRHGIEAWNIMGISPGCIGPSAYSLVDILRGVSSTIDTSCHWRAWETKPNVPHTHAKGKPLTLPPSQALVTSTEYSNVRSDLALHTTQTAYTIGIASLVCI
jgi:hypothetical protein